MLNFIPWNVNPVIFQLGPIGIRWYSLLFASGFVFGYLILSKYFKKEKAPQVWLDTIGFAMFIGILVGARVGHCLFYEPEIFLHNPLEVILPFTHTRSGWEFTGFQGLSSHGGAIGALLAFAYVTYKTKLPILWILDRVVIVTALTGCLIRLGNLMNSEIYGHVTNMPWGFIFVRDHQTLPHHPTQIYEALSYLSIFFLLRYLYLKDFTKTKPGLLTGVFFVTIFTARFIIEFWKEVQVTFEQSMLLDMGQILSIPFVLIWVALIVMAWKDKLQFKPPLPKVVEKKKK